MRENCVTHCVWSKMEEGKIKREAPEIHDNLVSLPALLGALRAQPSVGNQTTLTRWHSTWEIFVLAPKRMELTFAWAHSSSSWRTLEHTCSPLHQPKRRPPKSQRKRRDRNCVEVRVHQFGVRLFWNRQSHGCRFSPRV